MAKVETVSLMINPRLADHEVKVGDLTLTVGEMITATPDEAAVLKKHHTRHSGERIRTFVDWVEPEKSEEDENPDLSSVTLTNMSGKLTE